MKKASVIGHLGIGHDFFDGQTVKTKNITNELRAQLGEAEVLTSDTHGGIKTLLKSPIVVLRAFCQTRNVIMLPAHNGLRVYGRLLPFYRRFFKNRKIHYVVIGGWLPQFLIKRKAISNALKTFDGIYVETNTMKNALEMQGFDNIFVMPNCKKLTVLSENELVYPSDLPYKLCTFSRVMKEKGIEDAVNAVVKVNELLERQVFSLDIYGQVDGAQTEWFDLLQKNFPSYIRYGGVIPFDESVDVLKGYFALLFPTCYEGEGFAGTLIDAYSAGVPVIASDWKYNSELVNENVGCIYPTGDQVAFVDALKAVAINPTSLLCKKQFCLKEANKYKTNKVIQVLIEQIESD